MGDVPKGRTFGTKFAAFHGPAKILFSLMSHISETTFTRRSQNNLIYNGCGIQLRLQMAFNSAVVDKLTCV